MCVMDGLATFSSLEDIDTTFGGLDDEEEYSNVNAAGLGNNSSFEFVTIFDSVKGLDEGRTEFDGVTTKGSCSLEATTFSSSV